MGRHVSLGQRVSYEYNIKRAGPRQQHARPHWPSPLGLGTGVTLTASLQAGLCLLLSFLPTVSSFFHCPGDGGGERKILGRCLASTSAPSAYLRPCHLATANCLLINEAI